MWYNKAMKNYQYRNKKNNLILKLIDIVKKNPEKTIKIVAIILLIIAIIIGLSVIFKTEQKQKYVEYDGKNINEVRYPGYKELIDNLQKNHPNWTFTLFYTKLKWDDVIASEGHKDGQIYPLNLVPDSSDYPSDWKCEIDKNKKYDNGTWLCASNKAIKCQMDPRNILTEEKVFQFKELEYVEDAQTVSGLMQITNNTFLQGENIANALIQAGKNADVDPYFVASRLIQEQGKKGSTMSKGYQYDENTVVYNPFNIGAIGNSKDEILKNVGEYAYKQGWTSLESAIVGGIEYVKKDYINKGQKTLYLQKFDVVNSDGELYKNQYMQNLLAPESEGKSMLKIYKASNTVDAHLNFIIPLFENMPKQVSEK